MSVLEAVAVICYSIEQIVWRLAEVTLVDYISCVLCYWMHYLMFTASSRCWRWINRCSIIWNSRLKSACWQETNHAWVPEEITQQEIWGLGEHCLEDVELFMMWRIPVSFCGIVPYQCRGTCWTLKFHGKHSHSVSGLVSGLSAITSTLLCDHLA